MMFTRAEPRIASFTLTLYELALKQINQKTVHFPQVTSQM